MTNMTMGQRIAAQRKLKGLSQEALSEQLDVSRQAISKWESDGAIPEVDKLIALGRIFGVSVGWILGTETECRYDPDAGLNEAQTEMVEKIVARCQRPERPKWQRLLAGVCAAVLALGVVLHYQNRIDLLSEQNAVTQTQLAELAQTNQQMQAQLDAVDELLQKQNMDNRLLMDYEIQGFADEKLEYVTLTFVLTPKVFQESKEAILRITEPDGDVQDVACRGVGDAYLVQVNWTLMDGLSFRLLLVGEESYEEELLNDRDPALGLLKTYAGFTLTPEHPLYKQMLLGTEGEWPADQRTYHFSGRIQPPSTLPIGSFAYQSIDLTLYHNDEAIWTLDWKDEFQNAYGANRNYALPVPLEFSAELPELTEGDRLRLELKAVHTEGQEVTTVLDERIVE